MILVITNQSFFTFETIHLFFIFSGHSKSYVLGGAVSCWLFPVKLKRGTLLSSDWVTFSASQFYRSKFPSVTFIQEVKSFLHWIQVNSLKSIIGRLTKNISHRPVRTDRVKFSGQGESNVLSSYYYMTDLVSTDYKVFFTVLAFSTIYRRELCRCEIHTPARILHHRSQQANSTQKNCTKSCVCKFNIVVTRLNSVGLFNFFFK